MHATLSIQETVFVFDGKQTLVPNIRMNVQSARPIEPESGNLVRLEIIPGQGQRYDIRLVIHRVEQLAPRKATILSGVRFVWSSSFILQPAGSMVTVNQRNLQALETDTNDCLHLSPSANRALKTRAGFFRLNDFEPLRVFSGVIL